MPLLGDAIHYWMFARYPEMQQIWGKHKEDYHHGMIVGVVDLVDVVTECDSPWFVRGSAYGWILKNARAFDEPIPYKGKQGLFSVPVSEVENAMRNQHAYRLCTEGIK